MSGGDTIGKYFSFTVEISQTGFNLAVCVGFVSLSDESGIESAEFLFTPQHMKIIIHCKLVCFLTQTFATEFSCSTSMLGTRFVTYICLGIEGADNRTLKFHFELSGGSRIPKLILSTAVALMELLSHPKAISKLRFVFWTIWLHIPLVILAEKLFS